MALKEWKALSLESRARMVADLVQSLQASDKQAIRQAVEVLEELGPLGQSAAPFLLKQWIKEQGGEMDERHVWALQLLRGMGEEVLWRATEDQDPQVRRKALWAYPEAKINRVVTKLLGLYEGAKAPPWVSEKLVKAGPESIPTMVQVAQSASVEIALGLVEVLGVMKGSGKEAAAGLVTFLKDERPDVAPGAVESLADLGREAVPVLVISLKDRDKRVRKGSVKALGKMGAAAGEAVPAVIESLKDGDSDLVRESVKTLVSIGTPEAIKAVDQYHLQSPSPR